MCAHNGNQWKVYGILSCSHNLLLCITKLIFFWLRDSFELGFQTFPQNIRPIHLSTTHITFPGIGKLTRSQNSLMYSCSSCLHSKGPYIKPRTTSIMHSSISHTTLNFQTSHTQNHYLLPGWGLMSRYNPSVSLLHSALTISTLKIHFEMITLTLKK